MLVCLNKWTSFFFFIVLKRVNGSDLIVPATFSRFSSYARVRGLRFSRMLFGRCWRVRGGRHVKSEAISVADPGDGPHHWRFTFDRDDCNTRGTWGGDACVRGPMCATETHRCPVSVAPPPGGRDCDLRTRIMRECYRSRSFRFCGRLGNGPARGAPSSAAPLWAPRNGFRRRCVVLSVMGLAFSKFSFAAFRNIRWLLITCTRTTEGYVVCEFRACVTS